MILEFHNAGVLCISKLCNGACNKAISCTNSSEDLVAYNRWTRILGWTAGLAFFRFLHIFGLLVIYRALKKLYPTEISVAKTIFKDLITCSTAFMHSLLLYSIILLAKNFSNS